MTSNTEPAATTTLAAEEGLEKIRTITITASSNM